jgi:hypothetical protein
MVRIFPGGMLPWIAAAVLVGLGLVAVVELDPREPERVRPIEISVVGDRAPVPAPVSRSRRRAVLRPPADSYSEDDLPAGDDDDGDEDEPEEDEGDDD